MDLSAIQPVPQASINGMIVTLVVVTTLVIALMAWAKIRLKASLINFVLGSVTFIVFAMFLETILHGIVLKNAGELMKNHIVLYALYGGLAAALFEEVGRFVAIRFVMKKPQTKENAIMYGIGHGGIEVFVLVGITYLSNIIVSQMINNGTVQSTMEAMDEATKLETFQGMEPLWTTPSLNFYLAGIERIVAVAIHIELSYLVYRYIKTQEAKFMALAFVIHFATDTLSVLLAQVAPIWLAETTMVLIAAGIGYWVYKLYNEESETAQADY